MSTLKIHQEKLLDLQNKKKQKKKQKIVIIGHSFVRRLHDWQLHFSRIKEKKNLGFDDNTSVNVIGFFDQENLY